MSAVGGGGAHGEARLAGLEIATFVVALPAEWPLDRALTEPSPGYT
jgi:hypothetical protein